MSEALLLELLERHPVAMARELWRRDELPVVVQETMWRHPASGVRAAVAGHRSVEPRIREALVDDPEQWVAIAAGGRRDQRSIGADAVRRLLVRIFDGTFDEIRGPRDDVLFDLLSAEDGVLRIATGHPDVRVRRWAARFAMVDSPLLGDSDPEVRAVAEATVAERLRLRQPGELPDRICHGTWWVLQQPMSAELIDLVVARDVPEELGYAARQRGFPADLAATLLEHPHAEVRAGVAQRKDLTDEQLRRLVADPAVEVRTAVSVHPGLTEEQRDRLDVDLTLDVLTPWHGEVSAGWARSVNPLLRRRAAGGPPLPDDLVAVLAEDPEPGVRLMTALRQPAAPPALLLRSFLDLDGDFRRLVSHYLVAWDRLRELPRFPGGGLARFADHADPAVRKLVALDPDAEPELIAGLLADRDPGVRKVMAACPRLAAERIVALLDDPELGEDAAANPALDLGDLLGRLQEEADQRS
ncbi:hypothetical protein BJ973_004995 [Actinoplanes tereljensis]|uniref:hypothetical protein n=1 Tax=Paractinoplanes tereljensis TaxID=571912 RepID=UPI0019440F69|nr:hypothetical protein [Actinoplanes tereljensis]